MAASEYTNEWFEERLVGHPDIIDCLDAECIVCSYRDCPDKEPLHYHHDGCPACYPKQVREQKRLNELDRKVAEVIFGTVPCEAWRQVNFGSAGGPGLTKQEGDCSHPKCYPTQVIGSMWGPIGGCPRYSTDHDHCWSIVQSLESQGAVFVLYSMFEGRSVYRAVFSDPPHPFASNPVIFDAEAQTLEEAICLAALKWAEATKVEEDDEMAT